MEIKEKVYIAFCKHSWKVFNSEYKAMEFIQEQEYSNEYWSITPGEVTFNLPGEKPSSNKTNGRSKDYIE